MNDRTEENDPRIERAIEQLPAEIEPARDLWPGVEARIREAGAPGGRRASRGDERWRWLAIAAGVAVVATSLVFGLKDRGESPVAGLAPPQSAEPGGPGWDAANASNGRDVLAALDARADELDPATVRVIRENLAVIDDALAEIEGALEQDPANARMAALKMSGERRRGQVLRKAAVLAGSI